MKIAAGVILIIAAIFNLIGSFGYLAFGSAGTVGSVALEQAAEDAAKEDGTEVDEQAMKDLQTMQSGGVGLLLFGIFLLVSVGILIAGAVFLFKESNPKFIYAAGGMAIAAEVIGALISTFGVTNTVGLVGGVLAILGAKSIASAQDSLDSET